MLSTDFRKELSRLNREALFGLLELVDTLVDRPSAYARLAENIGLVLRNANYLLNLLRAHQARGRRTCTPQETHGRQQGIIARLCLCMPGPLEGA